MRRKQKMATPTNENLIRKYQLIESQLKTDIGLTGKITSILFKQAGATPDENVWEITTDEAQ